MQKDRGAAVSGAGGIVERRACAEVRDGQDKSGPRIAGYAAVFGVETELAPGRWERIAPGAFARSIEEKRDVVMMFNHDVNYTLARVANGTLALAEDERGLVYDGAINLEDAQAMSVYAKVQRRDVRQSSFGFVVVEERFSTREDGGELREVVEAELWDVSPVTWPAYADTEATARMAWRNAGGMKGTGTSRDEQGRTRTRGTGRDETAGARPGSGAADDVEEAAEGRGPGPQPNADSDRRALRAKKARAELALERARGDWR